MAKVDRQTCVLHVASVYLQILEHDALLLLRTGSLRSCTGQLVDVRHPPHYFTSFTLYMVAPDRSDLLGLRRLPFHLLHM
jgi:hypothetical protein